MSTQTNNHMTKQQIIDAASDISNSLYNLWKNNELSDNDYQRLRPKILDFYRDSCWTVLYEARDLRADPEFIKLLEKEGL